jgi:hypothetical protein
VFEWEENVFRYINISIFTLALVGVASAASIDPAVSSDLSSSDGALFSTAAFPAGFNYSETISQFTFGNAPNYIPADNSQWKASNITAYSGSTPGASTQACPYSNIFGGMGASFAGGPTGTCEGPSDDFIFALSGTNPSTYTLQFTMSSAVTVYGFEIYLYDDGPTDSDRGASNIKLYDGTVGQNVLVTNDTLTTGGNSYTQQFGYEPVLLTDEFDEGVTSQTFTFTFTGNSGTRVYGIESLDSPVPEPGTWMLAGLGMLGLAAATKMRNRRLQSKL